MSKIYLPEKIGGEKQKQIMADLYMKGINHDGHSCNTYGDIEDAVADILEEKSCEREEER